MENLIGNRISLLIKQLGHNKNSFSKAIGLSNNVTIGNIANGVKKPSFEVLEKIIQSFDNINVRWLITGEGEPLITPGDNKTDCASCREKDRIIKELQEQSIKDKERIIQLLEKKSSTKKAC
jgi:transcriptional regulator with XRE-family HTH domain